MRGLVAGVLVLVASLAALGGAAAARSPRLEKLALRPADTRHASQSVIRLSDLVAGWKGGAVRANADSVPDCASQDYSPFTLTGQAEADYQDGVTLLISVANLFPSAVESLGDFTVSTRAGTAECEGAAFRKDFGTTAKLVSAREVAAPNVGQRAAAFRFVIKVQGSIYYSDVIQFIRGRALGAVIAVSQGHPLKGPEALARIMDARFQVGSA